MKKLSLLYVCCFSISLATKAQINVFRCSDVNGKSPLEITQETAQTLTNIEVKRHGLEVYDATLYYTDMIHIICVPPALRSNNCLKEILCKNYDKSEPEESLKWLNEIKSNKTYNNKKLNLDFTSKFFLAPISQLALPLPPYYYSPNDSCLILYNSNNIGSDLKIADQENDVTLYKLRNAVLLKRNGVYYWLFISDGSITDGNMRLRFDAIRSAKLMDGKVIVERVNSMDEGSVSIFVIDYTTGVLRCYNNRPDQKFYTGYTVVDNSTINLNIQDGGVRLIHL